MRKPGVLPGVIVDLNGGLVGFRVCNVVAADLLARHPPLAWCVLRTVQARSKLHGCTCVSNSQAFLAAGGLTSKIWWVVLRGLKAWKALHCVISIFVLVS